MRSCACLHKVTLTAATFSLGVILFSTDSLGPGRPFWAEAASLRLGQQVYLAGDENPWSVVHVPKTVPYGDFVGLRRGEDTAAVGTDDIRLDR